VKITPWVHGNCNCYAALLVPKSSIASITSTGDQHFCCGRILRIADIEFREEERSLYSVFTQLLARASQAQVSNRGSNARDAEDCQIACGDEYQSCLEGCDPRDGGCIYSCKLRLQRCLKGCQEPPPSVPPQDLPTESCNISITFDVPIVGELNESENISNQLLLSGPYDVRHATMDPIKIVRRDATTLVTPGRGRYVRGTGEISFPASVEVSFAGSKIPGTIRLTTGSVRSPSGKYSSAGAPLDLNTREFTLVSAGAIQTVEYFVAVVVTLVELPQ